MKLKKLTAGILAAGMMIGSAFSASAYSMNMYVKNHYVTRDMQTMGKFDMLPIMDIAGELGYQVYYENGKFWLFNDSVSYEFTVGKADFYDQDWNWYGLDVVPQFIGGKLRLPSSFFTKTLGLSYTYDDVTKTLFIDSDSSYKWLIGTWEYQNSAPMRRKKALPAYRKKLKNTSGAKEYTIFDMDKDGVEELIIRTSNYLYFYTYYDGSVIYLGESMSGGPASIIEETTLVRDWNGALVIHDEIDTRISNDAQILTRMYLTGTELTSYTYARTPYYNSNFCTLPKVEMRDADDYSLLY